MMPNNKVIDDAKTCSRATDKRIKKEVDYDTRDYAIDF